MELKLQWFQRKDGLWNCDCPCGSALCGASELLRQEHEDWHLITRSGRDPFMARMHALAFAPERRDWLRAWWLVSELCWKINREAPSYSEYTRLALPHLTMMDLMRDELKKEVPRGNV